MVTSVNARFEDLVIKLENHRALIDVKIEHVKADAVTSSTQLGIVRYRLQKLLNRESELEVSINRWRVRAVQLCEINPQQALRCVQALNKSQELIEQIRNQLSLEQRQEQELQIRLAHLDVKLDQLHAQRESLSAGKSTLPSFAEAYTEGFFASWEQVSSANEPIKRPSGTPNEVQREAESPTKN